MKNFIIIALCAIALTSCTTSKNDVISPVPVITPTTDNVIDLLEQRIKTVKKTVELKEQLKEARLANKNKDQEIDKLQGLVKTLTAELKSSEELLTKANESILELKQDIKERKFQDNKLTKIERLLTKLAEEESMIFMEEE